ncbi:Lrp/AsnC family transcriptional regulator [Kitasatospora sp. YST-16]|uniref:Lrp/AsnC family transcriptional regulator n=1 Tax=Kitasatospora TaxID=2063 RepID=UPI0004C44A83|nr:MULTISPECIES: Lrp/AsnC family transcriptional regulator [unclassified Kitasatospora]WAL71640.1 Lrp/AsnC family transcriptional regulator [Kitasatospora sp. YST-16]WNW37680.1 Lrp/AsnC family transcriptional regulator [Streptomyces sp. Li-HN-5-13]
MDTGAADPAAVLDALDRRLVHALQVDGRAEPGRIAEVLGVSARTVTRRLGRLLGTGAVRVVRMPDAREAALGALLLRVRVLRGRVEAIALALAAQDGVPFVDVMLGGQEVSAVVLAEASARDRLLHGRLPATDAVLESTAHAVLHLFADASAWRCGALTADQEAALAPPPAPAGPPPALDALDHRLLDALGVDARRSHAALAAALQVPESTVRRRLHRLGAGGLLRTHVSVDPRLVGAAVDANLWLDVEPGRLAATGEALARHPQVHGVLATSGPSNLMAAVFCPDHAALYRFQTGVLGPLGVRRVETAIVARAVKRAGVRLRQLP